MNQTIELTDDSKNVKFLVFTHHIVSVHMDNNNNCIIALSDGHTILKTGYQPSDLLKALEAKNNA